MRSIIKDNFLLLGTGLLCALLAATFWKYAGEYGAYLIMAIAFLSLIADNWSLRKKLKKYQEISQKKS